MIQVCSIYIFRPYPERFFIIPIRFLRLWQDLYYDYCVVLYWYQ